MAGISGDASNARRGERLRTVAAFPFENDAVETNITGKSFISLVRTLSSNLRVNDSGNGYDKLLRFVRIQIYKSDNSVNDFEELCESLISAFYFGLAYPKLGQWKTLQSIFTCFLEKWFDAYETYDIDKLITEIEEKYRISSFATAILLSCFGDEMPMNCLEELLNWHADPQLASPQWLREITTCVENVFGNFNKILFKNLNYFDSQIMLTFDREFLNSVSIFLEAIKSYRLKMHEESFTTLNSIKHENCGQFLLGWKELLIGLNLEHMNKENCALMKFKNAMDQDHGCYYALYFSSRVLKKLGHFDGQAECLQLLAQVNTAAAISSDNTLQRVILARHMPVVDNLKCRSLWLLTSSYLANEKWAEARHQLNSLLKNWRTIKEMKCTSNFLDPQDEIPELPSKEFVTLCYLHTLMNMKLYHEVENNNNNKLDDLEGSLSGLSDEEKMKKLSVYICHLMLAEALYQQAKFESSLASCSSVLIILEPLYTSDGRWQILVLLIKIYLYKILSLLYLEKSCNMLKNSRHFSRLQDECLHLLNELKQNSRDESYEKLDTFVAILQKRVQSIGVEL